MPTTKEQPRKSAKKNPSTQRATGSSTQRTSTSSTKRAPTSSTKKWSGNVTKHSNALDLDKGIFKSKSPNKIARSLEDSAEKSTRKKGSSYQSAMSMLNFYINRAGKNLPADQKKILIEAKTKLKALHAKQK